MNSLCKKYYVEKAKLNLLGETGCFSKFLEDFS